MSATPWNDDPILEVEHLTMRFGGLVAVNDLSFKAGRGEITALIGPNGLDEYVRSTHVLEAFWNDNTLGYGILSAEKPVSS